jgi:hypothetical protein
MKFSTPAMYSDHESLRSDSSSLAGSQEHPSYLLCLATSEIAALHELHRLCNTQDVFWHDGRERRSRQPFNDDATLL